MGGDFGIFALMAMGLVVAAVVGVAGGWGDGVRRVVVDIVDGGGPHMHWSKWRTMAGITLGKEHIAVYWDLLAVAVGPGLAFLLRMVIAEASLALDPAFVWALVGVMALLSA